MAPPMNPTRRQLLMATAAAAAGWPALGRAAAEPAVLIPLVAGLRVTTAVHERGVGDYESSKTLLGRLPAPAAGWRIELQTTRRGPRPGSPPRTVQSQRQQADADLAQAGTYRPRFEDDAEEEFPGTTALGLSARVLAALRAGRSALRVVEDPSAFMPGQADPLGLGALFAAGEVVLSGELLRAEPVQPRVLPVCGQPMALPVLRASGLMRTREGQAVPVQLDVLDDLRNPLALGWQIGVHRLAVVRIDWPRPDDASRLATELARRHRVVLPGLNFDTGSAVLRPQSAAALDAIVQATRALPAGAALRIEGHTDNLGEARANQALSLARAQAVRTALVQRESALGARLQTVGLGAGQPVDDNATLEGRARNRRVELVVLSG
jgi:outer membrane protein OmpA-like peptidoglycan-associated protein